MSAKSRYRAKPHRKGRKRTQGYRKRNRKSAPTPSIFSRFMSALRRAFGTHE